MQFKFLKLEFIRNFNVEYFPKNPDVLLSLDDYFFITINYILKVGTENLLPSIYGDIILF